jgi:acyl-CoA dehydrogenase
MNFLLSTELAALRDKVRSFVEQHVLPQEKAILDSAPQSDRAGLKALQHLAREQGLWVPHLPRSLGGLGLGPMGMCALFREMGKSPIGAKVFNCDAPDQGNMDLLLAAGSDAQQRQYLAPLVDAHQTSAFCMTEPAPGAGADPSNLATTATHDGTGWLLSGRKWYSTGAKNAAFFIVMARTSDDPKRGATMFLVDKNTPGVRYVRDVPVMGPSLLDHIEGELEFDRVRLSDTAVLGGEGEGFRLAQVRLVPARLTHCMRWLGLAERALALCRPYITSRVSFGKELARHQAIQAMLARAASGIHAGNLMTLHCATLLEAGMHQEAKTYSSMAKNHVAQVLCQTLDDAIQMHGGSGYSEDLPFATWYRVARAARIADGPDEVHQMVIARDWLLGRVDLLV